MSDATAAPQRFLDGRVTLHAGDSRDVLKTIADCSIDSIVTDPPYALVSIGKRFGAEGAAPAKPGKSGAYARASAGFMGQKWDTGETAFDPAFWAECLRVLKPGGHVAAFSGTRTYHRMACAIEDAGFEVRDSILTMAESDAPLAAFMDSLNDAQRSALARCMDESQFGGMLGWVYGSGFPKSHDVSKGIDKAAGAAREKVRVPQVAGSTPASAAARAWEGWGTALKPAWEPICLARKPLDGTVAANVLAHGTGALNIDGCRVEGESPSAAMRARGVAPASCRPGDYGDGHAIQNRITPARWLEPRPGEALGRWPANILHDGGDEVVALFPNTSSGELLPHHRKAGAGLGGSDTFAIRDRTGEAVAVYGDSGSAARFFYASKADADDRIGSKHPTVKPLDLMQWLVRLITPPGGVTLDPFAGTGTAGEAAWREGFSAVLIEREAEFRADIARRMEFAAQGRMARGAAIAKARPRAADALPLFGDAAEGGADGSTASRRSIGPIGMTKW